MSSKDFKKILMEIPAGSTMTVREIQDFVKDHAFLTEEDWKIHTKTRPTNYRRWLHRLQAVLHEFKRKGIVIHHPSLCAYTFL